jgi:hypothetical protein
MSKEQYAQEVQGTICDVGGGVLEYEHIDALFDAHIRAAGAFTAARGALEAHMAQIQRAVLIKGAADAKARAHRTQLRRAEEAQLDVAQFHPPGTVPAASARRAVGRKSRRANGTHGTYGTHGALETQGASKVRRLNPRAAVVAADAGGAGATDGVGGVGPADDPQRVYGDWDGDHDVDLDSDKEGENRDLSPGHGENAQPPAAADAPVVNVVDALRAALHAAEQQFLRTGASPVFARDMRPVVWTMIDPSGGGRGSDYAALSLVCSAGREVLVVGMGSKATRTHDQLVEFLGEYFGRLQAHPQLQGCVHAIGIENNFGGSLMCDMLYTRDLPQIVPGFVPLCVGDVRGLCSDPENTRHGVRRLQTLMVTRRLKLAAGLVWAGRPTAEAVLEEARSQFTRLKFHNGKFSGKGSGGLKDDVVMLAVRLPFWIEFFIAAGSLGDRRSAPF